MQSIQIIPKLDGVKTYIKDTQIGIFIDNSGSTGNKINDKKIILFELGFALNFRKFNTTICSWCDSAKVHFQNQSWVSKNSITPETCTEPSCILRNNATRLVFENSETIIFMTDGEISANDVTRFASQICEIIKNKTIICVITTMDIKDRINISVFAPFLFLNRVIIFSGCLVW